MVAGLIMIASDGCRQQLTQWLHLCAVAKEHKSPTGIFPLALDLQHGPVVSPMPYFVVTVCHLKNWASLIIQHPQNL